jgi:hypothetical protein
MRSRGLPSGPSLMGLRLPFLRTLTIICFCVVPLTKFHCLAAQIIPPVTGRVVDSITGRPIQGISLTLQISTYEGFSVHTDVKSTATSDFSGRFSLAAAIHQTESPFDRIRAYWVTVNDGFDATGLEENSAATQVLYNPMSNRRGVAVGDKRYFPLTITFRSDGCDRVWAATCMHIMSWTDIAIPLIPVLGDVYGCNAIGESSLHEKCRQLNSYRGAYAHIDTYEEVQEGKKLCSQVDDGIISAECLRQLPVYIANPQAYERAAVPSPIVPLPEGMFVEAIGHVPRFNQGCGMLDIVTGHFHCGANYGPKEYVFWVAVGVEEWPDSESARNYFPVEKPQFTDYKEATVKDEVLPGGKVRLYQGPQNTAVYWVSKNKFVQVFFYRPIPEQDEFIAHYLTEFPSTLQ